MQFLYPSFLWALAAVAIPVIIHLFQFRRHKTIYFSNVRLLRQVQQESASSSKLKHLLVLASRMLAIVCLVMAFAQPFIPKRAQQAVAGKSYVSVFIDNSFSMNRVSDGFTLLDKAKQTAADIAKGYNDDDRFQLITNDFSGAQQRLIGKEEFLAALDGISFSSASRKIDEVARRQSDVLASENGDVKTAYLISDFQKGMEQNFTPDTSVKFNLLPLAAQSASNLFIDSCLFFEPVQLVNQNNTLIVRIKNSSDADVSDNRLTMKLNGQTKAISNFNVNANGYVLDTIKFTNEQAGWNKAELYINDNDVTFDDSYFIAFHVMDKVDVLCINDGVANKFVNAVFAKHPQFNFQHAQLNSLNFEQLKQFRFVVLANLTQVPSGLISAISGFVADGGAVAVFPAYKADVESFNKLLLSIGGQAIETFSDAATESAQPNIQQNIFKDVFEKTPENMRLPAVRKYAVFSKTMSPTREDILQTRDGNMLVARYLNQKGTAYVSAVALDEQNSELPVNALFAPMLYKMAVLNSGSAAALHTIGSRTVLPANALAGKENVLRVNNQKTEFIPQQYSSGSQTILVLGDEISQAGFYNVSAPGNDSAIALIAANYNRAESVMNFMQSDDLRKAFASLSNVNVLNENISNVTAKVKSLDKATLLWKYFLIAALLFLALEILLLRFWK